MQSPAPQILVIKCPWSRKQGDTQSEEGSLSQTADTPTAAFPSRASPACFTGKDSETPQSAACSRPPRSSRYPPEAAPFCYVLCVIES